MFEHLLSPEFDSIAEASTEELLNAKARVLDFLEPVPDAGMADATDARKAFTELMIDNSLRSDSAVAKTQRDAVLALKTPEAVRHLVGMLSAYDWDFIEQAKQIRSYVVAKLLEETQSTDARIRLRALELTGKLTEVASFTERQEVVHKNENSAAVEERLRARLKSLLPPVQVVEDAEIKDIAIVPHDKHDKDAPDA